VRGVVFLRARDIQGCAWDRDCGCCDGGSVVCTDLALVEEPHDRDKFEGEEEDDNKDEEEPDDDDDDDEEEGNKENDCLDIGAARGRDST
jgi:hypothetical protein